MGQCGAQAEAEHQTNALLHKRLCVWDHVRGPFDTDVDRHLVAFDPRRRERGEHDCTGADNVYPGRQQLRGVIVAVACREGDFV